MLQMVIIFNEQGLDDIQFFCVVQIFYNYNVVLYKVFVIGEKYYIVERFLIKNFVVMGKEFKRFLIKNFFFMGKKYKRFLIKNILFMEKNCNMYQKVFFVEIIYRQKFFDMIFYIFFLDRLIIYFDLNDVLKLNCVNFLIEVCFVNIVIKMNLIKKKIQSNKFLIYQ